MMFSKPVTQDQLFALAGMFHACQLVDDMARHGSVDSKQLDIHLRALLNQNPETTYSVYGTDREDALHNLAPGIQAMQSLLGQNKKSAEPNVLRYLVSVAFLARKLSQNSAMLNRVGEGIHNASLQAETFSISHENVIANIAQLYKDTIGTFRQRIQVNGYADHLQQPVVANRIRCLLFAAIRSAILWNQLGGRRSQLLFQRRKIVDQLHRLQRQP